MKGRISIRFLLSVVTAGLGLISADPATAQTFTVLHTLTNSDGVYPYGGALTLFANRLYAATTHGGSSGYGSSGYGTVFSVNRDGTGVSTLHDFNYDDGAYPETGLTLSGDILYGTSNGGGNLGYGTVFALNTNGTGFVTLYNFSDYSDGGDPNPGLLLSSNTLYGTTSQGGFAYRGGGFGTVFSINTDGTGFKTLHSLDGSIDGGAPTALILSGTNLYGTAAYGGTSGGGTVFKVNTDGTGFETLHSFEYRSGPDGLTLSGNTLYGTTEYGGTSQKGTVFALNTDGTGFTNLHVFTALSNRTNADGALPFGVILSGNTLYGTAIQGGSSGNGTVFRVNTNGLDFTNIYSFTGNDDGANPWSGLILSENTLYGATWSGGSWGGGTVFSIFIQPQLTMIYSGPNVILTWPTNYAGFTLQSATNLVSPIWTANSPTPVVVNGQNTVTNPISGTQQFYRLSQ